MSLDERLDERTEAAVRSISRIHKLGLKVVVHFNTYSDTDAFFQRLSRLCEEQVLREISDNKCPVCDGCGGIAFVGSEGPGIPCGRCNGTGKV